MKIPLVSMNLLDKDRKQLWTAAAGICSYHYNGESCFQKLFVNNGTMDTNLGEECHIIGDKPGTARHQKEFAGKETYNNAILLCHSHHKIVDDNPNVYTVDVLKRMKNEHEIIISEKLAKEEIPRFVLKNTQLSLIVDKAKEDVIGLDVQKPTLFSNVGVNVQVKEG